MSNNPENVLSSIPTSVNSIEEEDAMDTSQSVRSPKRKKLMADCFDGPATGGPVIISPVGDVSSFRGLDLKARSNFIDELVEEFGPIKKGTRWTANGELMIYPTMKNQKKKLLDLRFHGGLSVSCQLSKSEQSARGIVRVPVSFSEEDLKEALADQGVVDVKRFHKGEGATKKPTPIVSISFNSPKLPAGIFLAHERFRVERFIPRPMQCINCWDFGHRSDSCPNKRRCRRCSSNGCTDEVCQKPQSCHNCHQSDHDAGAPFCPVMKSRQAVIRYAYENGISISEAGHLLSSRRTMDPPPSRTSSQGVSVRPLPADEEMGAMKARLSKMESDLARLRSVVIPFTGQVESLKATVEPLPSQVRSLQVELDMVRNESAATSSKVEDLNTKVDSGFGMMLQQFQKLHQLMGNPQPLLQLQPTDQDLSQGRKNPLPPEKPTSAAPHLSK